MQQTTTQHETFMYEQIDHVARITFNRPETLNSLTFEVYAELRDTFRDLNRWENVRAVVITARVQGFVPAATWRPSSASS